MTTLPQTTLAPPSTIHPLRAALICLGAGVICSSVLLFEDFYVYFLLFAMLACFLGPLWVSWYRKQLDYFEAIHVFGLLYFCYFALGGIWTLQDPRNVAYDYFIVPYIPKAMLYCLLGYLAFLAGYYLPWMNRAQTVVRRERVNGGLFFVVLGGLGVLAYLAEIMIASRIGVGRLPVFLTSLTQFRMLFLFTWSLAWLLFFGRTMTSVQRYILFLYLIPGAVFVCYLTLSNKSLIMTILGLPVVAFWYCRGRVPWKFLAAMMLVSVFLIFPFYNTYRNVDRDLSQGDRLETTYRKLDKVGLDEHVKESLTMFKTRLAMINSVAVVLRDVPRWVPYQYGRTIFVPMLALLIPRVIWADKPLILLGREFGSTFRITHALDKETYIAVTLPGEFCWNFGLPGVIGGMAFVGVCLRFLYRRYGEGRQRDPLTRATYMTLLVSIAYLGASVALNAGELVRMIVIFEALRWLGRNYGFVTEIAEEPNSNAGNASTERIFS